MEEFSPKPSPTPVQFNEDNILDNVLLYGFGLLAYTGMSRGCADVDGEPVCMLDWNDVTDEEV